MRYREFGKLGFKTSTFGMGCMRLPTVKDTEGNNVINEPEAIKMIRHAIDSGVNYIDTAYPYHNGQSEIVVGKALQDGYRSRTKLATKLPVWLVKSSEDFEKLLDEQLKKLQTDHIDFYLLHSMTRDRWNTVKGLGVREFLDRMVEKGKILYPGFSFHDELDVFKAIIDDYDWKMCQIQLNFLDMNYQAGVEGLKYAASKGIPVVIMEPLKGGKLSKHIPDDILNTWASYKEKRSPVEWAFRWLYNFPEIKVILSGVSNMEQLNDNLRIFDSAEPNCLSQEDLDLIYKVRDIYLSRTKVGCTGCEYCMPCPNNVNIPRIFSLYNDASMYGETEPYARNYKRLLEKNNGALSCVECGNCESACPQAINIIEKLKEAHAALSE